MWQKTARRSEIYFWKKFKYKKGAKRGPLDEEDLSRSFPSNPVITLAESVHHRNVKEFLENLFEMRGETNLKRKQTQFEKRRGQSTEVRTNDTSSPSICLYIPGNVERNISQCFNERRRRVVRSLVRRSTDREKEK